MLGWTAVTGSLHPYALQLLLIIFVWTPPHFWALAIFRVDDYSRAQVPMLPVTHGVVYTRWHILFYTILLCVVTLLPFFTGMSGLIYLFGAVILGAGFLWYAIRMLNPPDELFAMKMFNYSIVYLMVLFAFLLADPPGGLGGGVPLLGGGGRRFSAAMLLQRLAQPPGHSLRPLQMQVMPAIHLSHGDLIDAIDPHLQRFGLEVRRMRPRQ